jgi:hypothetical protein
VDGSIDVHHTAQEGQAGPDAYRQRTLESQAEASQLIPFGRSLQLRIGGRLRHEDYDSRIGGVESDFSRRAGQAQSTVDFGHGGLRFHLDGLQLEQTNTGSGVDFRRLSRSQLGTSAYYRGRAIRLDASGLFSNSRLEYPAAPTSRTQEWAGLLGARSNVPRIGELGYRVSLLVDRNLDSHFRTDNTTHTLTYSGGHKFARGRGLATLNTNSSFFFEKQVNQISPAGGVLRLPLNGGLLLDDTPEVQDPLEGDLVPVVELYDQNRQATTSINLGDSAPPVREFGGDYRNIEYDFGEPVNLSSAILYVDRTLLTPALFRWRLFTSNDPEGRVWVELDAAAATATYREWGTGLQGWEVTLSTPTPVRFFKMVDVKLGPTVPDLFVTELEAYAFEEEVSAVDHSRTTNHRLGFATTYSLTRTLRAGYDLMYHRRTLSLQPGALEERAHGFSAGWTRGLWALSGRYELHRLARLRARDRNTDAQRLSVRRGKSGAFAADLTWSRIRDDSDRLQKTTNSVDLGAVWPAAPALEIHQRIGVGWLDDRGRQTTSTSVFTNTSATGAPLPNVTLDLARTDRWVSAEAGAGFSRFNDTVVTLGWRPMPLVSFQSDLHYQVRAMGEWITRQSLTWEPISRGSVRLAFNAVHYRDTQARETQRTGGADFEWAARPSLTFRGTVQSSVFTTAGQENSPVNTEIRGTWRF